MVADSDLFHFYSFIEKNQGFIEEDNPSEEVIVEEELDGIDIDDIGNSEDSTRLKFINEECRDLNVVNDSGELIRNIN